MSSHDQIEQYYFLQSGNNDSQPKSIGAHLKTQYGSAEGRRFLVVKIVLVIIGLTLLTLNSLRNFIHPTAPVDCFEDVVQTWLLPVTEFLRTHNAQRAVMIIVASTLVDINMTCLYLVWIFYGKSLRLMITIASFYIFRGLTQRMFAMKFPSDYIFDDPDFFSVAVPYFKTNDFFFSGHIGICTIFFLEFRKQDKKTLKYLAVAAIVVNFLVLLITEGHFIIDLCFGVVAGHYCYATGEWIEGGVKESDNACFEMFRSRETEHDENEEGSDNNHNLNEVSYYNDNHNSL